MHENVIYSMNLRVSTTFFTFNFAQVGRVKSNANQIDQQKKVKNSDDFYEETLVCWARLETFIWLLVL